MSHYKLIYRVVFKNDTFIGADPVVVQGSGPHKNLVVGSSMAQTPMKILQKEI